MNSHTVSLSGVGGGQVNDAGIGLLLLLPAPYVDASDANQFTMRSQRAWVSAAGIVLELAVAAMAITIWSTLDPGLLRDIMFSSALIAGVSTVAFNANPLVRLDGYYLLTDIIALPNLAQRSRQFWQSWLAAKILTIDMPLPEAASGEKPWLVLYQPLALLYRIAILVGFAWWVSAYSPAMGLVIGVAAVCWLVLIPIGRFARLPWQRGASLSDVSRAWYRLAIISLVITLTGLIPFPDRSLALGVVWPGDQSVVRARHDGFVSELLIEPKQRVNTGDTVIQLVDPVIDTLVGSLESRLPGLRSAWLASININAVKARHTQERIRQANQEMAYVIESQDRLTAVSPSSGQLRLSQPWADMQGSFVHEGDVLGYIDRIDQPVVRTVLTQNQAARIKDSAEQPVGVSIRFLNGRPQQIAARALQFFPAPTELLPSPALARVNGGTISLDPSSADKMKPAQPGYVLDVIGLDAMPAPIGARAWVRLDFGFSPAFAQLARWLRQLINSDTASRFG